MLKIGLPNLWCQYHVARTVLEVLWLTLTYTGSGRLILHLYRISRILYLYFQDFLLWVGDIRMASIIGWTTAAISAAVTTARIAHYYLFLNPDELWTYNYCMHLPYVETERGAVKGISFCFSVDLQSDSCGWFITSFYVWLPNCAAAALMPKSNCESAMPS